MITRILEDVEVVKNRNNYEMAIDMLSAANQIKKNISIDKK